MNVEMQVLLPFSFRSFFQLHAGEVEPLNRARVIGAFDHVSEAWTVAEAVDRLVIFNIFWQHVGVFG
jgi:hypothetical protein